MNVVGTGMVVWHETRYLPLVLEQMERVPGPKCVLHCDKPMFWTADGGAPSGHKSGVVPILERFSSIPVLWREHQISDESTLRNIVINKLAEAKADVILWLDSDFIFDIGEFDSLIEAMRKHSLSCWSMPAIHFWRNWDTVYSTTRARFGFPSSERWADSGFSPELEQACQSHHATLWHPSYVLTDEEIHRKVHSFYHAPWFKYTGFWDKWKSGAADQEQTLIPRPRDIPMGIQERLAKWNAYV